MNHIIIAYAPQNASLAQYLDQKLSPVGIPFHQVADELGKLGETSGDPVILLVTDQLLTHKTSLHGLLPAVQELHRQNRLWLVLADTPNENGVVEPMQLDRMANVLHYMKYWQDQWIELSDRHQLADEKDKPALASMLEETRTIANQVGDLIGMFREIGFTKWDQLLENDFELLFQRYGLMEWHAQYRRQAATVMAPVDEKPSFLPEVHLSGGLLAPEPLEYPFQDTNEKNNLPETVQPSLQLIPAPSDQGSVLLEQSVKDAWFWLEKGHYERALDLFQTALEQEPENEWLIEEYHKALARFSPSSAPVEQPLVQELSEKDAKRELVLITGASSGIGKATAEIFAKNGYRLILTGRRLDRLEALKTQFETAYSTDVLLLPFDIRDNGAVEAALSKLPEEYKQVDILINNAGLAKGLSPIQEGNLEHWETMIDTNIKGLLYVTRLVSPGMVERRKGHIINVCSSAGREAYPNGNVYCATKFAVDALTKSMRFDLHPYDIRVSQVSPGHVEETEFALNRFDGDTERAKIYQDFQPLKSSDVAEAIYFLATRPPHVNIVDIQMFATQQASSMVINRTGRRF